MTMELTQYTSGNHTCIAFLRVHKNRHYLRTRISRGHIAHSQRYPHRIFKHAKCLVSLIRTVDSVTRILYCEKNIHYMPLVALLASPYESRNILESFILNAIRTLQRAMLAQHAPYMVKILLAHLVFIAVSNFIIVKMIRILAMVLCIVECLVCLIIKGCHTRTACRCHCNSYTRTHSADPVRIFDFIIQCPYKPGCEMLYLICLVQSGKKHKKLITTKPAGYIVMTHHFLNCLGYADQYPVSVCMPVCIINAFKIIYVHHECGTAGITPGQYPLHAPECILTIPKPRKRIPSCLFLKIMPHAFHLY